MKTYKTFDYLDFGMRRIKRAQRSAPLQEMWSLHLIVVKHLSKIRIVIGQIS